MANSIVNLRRGAGRSLLALAFALALQAQDPGAGQAADSPDYSSDAPPASPAAEPKFNLHLYSDLDFSHREDDSSDPGRFSVREIDLFGTYTLTPSLTALSEMVIDTGNATSQASVPFNVERLMLQYRVNDFLRIEAGQLRTSIGYYSTAYLRGAWFQTAISRPRMFSFEEDGGILALHLVGLSASGAIPSGPLGLHYVVETGNTRTWGTGVTAPTTSTSAGHDAVNFSLVARPRAVSGLEVGFSDFHDKFSPITGLMVDRSAFTAHVVYTANRFEFLNEGVVAHIHYAAANATGTFSGFYSQLGYRMGPNWGPYVRVEKLSIQADPFFAGLANIANWRSMYTAGVRYDWNDHVALKLELGHEADWGVPHYYQAAAQVAFAF